uniref:Uncharacterized protein n=1 Tax=Panstrongylus lignarius TaxID=156445 RepID=A0A224XQ02_9HEMI
MVSAAFLIPASSSLADASRDLKSNQDGILNPLLSVTGIVGAVGQITFAKGGRIALIALAHPCPVSPKPCKNIIVAVCFAVAAMTTGDVDMFWNWISDSTDPKINVFANYNIK